MAISTKDAIGLISTDDWPIPVRLVYQLKWYLQYYDVGARYRAFSRENHESVLVLFIEQIRLEFFNDRIGSGIHLILIN